LAKYGEQSVHEASVFLLDDLKFPLVEPNASATEAFVYVNVTKNNLFKLRATLRTLREVKNALTLALFSHQCCLPLLEATFCRRSISRRAKYSSSLVLGFTGIVNLSYFLKRASYCGVTNSSGLTVSAEQFTAASGHQTPHVAFAP
jgi:hypothetical protein